MEIHHLDRLCEIEERNANLMRDGIEVDFQESYQSFVKHLNAAILSGENFSVLTKSQWNNRRDRINASLTSQLASCNKIPVRQRESIQATISAKSNHTVSFDKLVQFTQRSLNDFSKQTKSVQQKNITFLSNVKPFQKIIKHFRLVNRTELFELETAFIQVNISLCELDFYLSASGKFIEELVELHSILQYWDVNKKEIREKIGLGIFRLIADKTRFILYKSLSKRADVGNVFYLSYATEHKEQLSRELELTNSFYEFHKISEQNKLKAIDVDSSESLRAYNLAKRKFNHCISNNEVHFPSAHFLCKYYRKNSDGLPRKISALNKILADIESVSKEMSIPRFNHLAYDSVSFLVWIAKLRCYHDELEKGNSLKMRSANRIPEVINFLKEIEAIYHHINKLYDERGDVSAVKIYEYVHHYHYLKCIIRVCEFIYDSLRMLATSDLKLFSNSVNSFLELVLSAMNVFPVYRDNLEWASITKHLPLYLPFEQCRLPKKEFSELEIAPFLCSTFLTPVNYTGEKHKQETLKSEIEFLVAKLLLLQKTENTKLMELQQLQHEELLAKQKAENEEALENAHRKIIDVSNAEILETEKRMKEQIETTKKSSVSEIKKSRLDSLQFLGLFSAVVALVIAGAQSLPNARSEEGFIAFGFAATLLTAVMLTFLSLLTLVTLSFEPTDRKTSLIKVAITVLIAFVLFGFSGLFYFKLPITKSSERQKGGVSSQDVDKSDTFKSGNAKELIFREFR